MERRAGLIPPKEERLETVGPYSTSKVLVVMGMGKQLIVH